MSEKMESQDSISFKSYSKVDDQQEQEAFQRKARKKCTIITISAILLVIVIVGALLGILIPMNNNKSNSNQTQPSSYSRSAESIKALCGTTRYPDSCYSSMSLALKSNDTTNTNTDPVSLFLLSLHVSHDELVKISSLPQDLISSKNYTNETNNPLLMTALHDCDTLFKISIDQVNESISNLQDNTLLLNSKFNSIRTWLSAALTNQDTCMEGLEEAGKQLMITQELNNTMTNSTEYISNSLAIATNMLNLLKNLGTPIHRRLLSHFDGDFPNWVSRKERRLLMDDQVRPKADFVVAKDGSGDFETISEAVSAVVNRSERRVVIYVKEGVYLEQVIVDKDCWNVMMYGDGMSKTIVSGSLNNVDGVSTFSSASFIAEGRGFIAKDMGFKNTAGPSKEQAVALRSSSQKSVFYRCSFEAYQDTLYTHSLAQFYRDCTITGTIDFIFGNAAVVFQNCSIKPRQPMQKQFNTITAQSKSDPNQNTGISIQGCEIKPFDNLTAPTYFGRPWKDYSTVVIMQSFVDKILDPLGWAPWNATKTPAETLFYGEFENFGPGSGTGKWVNWPGVWPKISRDVAGEFSVEQFIQGRDWLPQSLVIFQATL